MGESSYEKLSVVADGGWLVVLRREVEAGMAEVDGKEREEEEEEVEGRGKSMCLGLGDHPPSSSLSPGEEPLIKESILVEVAPREDERVAVVARGDSEVMVESSSSSAPLIS